MPILALLGPFRGVFGHWVGFGALWEPNFRNNQMDPFFYSIVFLHLNSWKSYSFEIFGPKLALNSQNWPKQTKIRFSQMAVHTLTADPAPPNFLFIHCSFPVLFIGTIEQDIKACKSGMKYGL